jgi:Periplasmic copper-binding protein (NosD)
MEPGMGYSWRISAAAAVVSVAAFVAPSASATNAHHKHPAAGHHARHAQRRASRAHHGRTHHRRSHHHRRHHRRVVVHPHPAPAPAHTAVASLASYGSVPVPQITGVKYYVSPQGSDSNSGLSPSQAWQSVQRVNNQALHPGDGVLFEGGQAFSDSQLMPPSSGSAAAPIFYGSYGTGQATIPHGVWFVQDHVVLENLAFNSTVFGGSEVKGTSNGVILEHDTITLPSGNQSLGLYANGQGWVIQDSTFNNTGLSGMLLNGDGYTVHGNTITNVGLDHSVGYNGHGIYLDAADATVTNNTITNAGESGVSARYRNSTIAGNTIANVNIGIDFYQTDPVAGRSSWTQNRISGTTEAGIYVCPNGAAGNTDESFTITGNAIHVATGHLLDVDHTSGTLSASGNAPF